MSDCLEVLLADGIIDDVLGRLKSGKEADVWLVRHRGEAVAAKIYKDRAVRSFKNNSGYVEGRKTRSSRTQRAMDKGSRFGRKAAEEAWKEAEADALFRLHAAEVRVPTPHMFYEGVLLMELVLGPDGGPAPRLVEAQLTRDEAAAIYEDLRGQMVRMLCCDLIHGDLSPYNVLLGERGPVIIDFPQTVDAAANNRASFYFQRDVDNIRNFLAGFDRRLHGRRSDAKQIWKAWEKRELTPDFEPAEAVPEAEGRQQEPRRPRGRGGPEVVVVRRIGDGAPRPSEGGRERPPMGQRRARSARPR